MTRRSQYNIIVACDVNNGIAKEGEIPWHISSDLKYFKTMTSHVTTVGLQNAVIMGRKTWESLPKKYRPLPNRINIVLSRKSGLVDESSVVWLSSFAAVQRFVEGNPHIETAWIIGGENIYRQAFTKLPIKFIYKTTIAKKFKCDQFFSVSVEKTNTNTNGTEEEEEEEKSEMFEKKKATECVEEDGTILHFEVYEKKSEYVKHELLRTRIVSKNKEEDQYLNLVRHILQNGEVRQDRTGVGTISVFGTQMRFNIRKSIPLLTTKRVFFRGVVEELLWFLRGDTNVRSLQSKKVRIWDGNSTPEYLKSVGLENLRNGDLGPIYGFQWRHFGATYTTGDADYTDAGVDQIARVIHQIKHTPDSRRIILSAWNPTDIDKMALPPCHCMYQFYVNNGELSCHMYQRSGDVGLGVPFNIASTSVLTYILAHICGLKPGDMIHSMGDAHIYSSHVLAMKDQCQRDPRTFPTLEISPLVKSIDDLEYSDFTLHNYKPLSSIKMKMAV